MRQPRGAAVRAPTQRRDTVTGAAIAALLAVALAHPAVGADAPVIQARLLVALPPDSALAIEPRDDSDENLRLRDLMVARLRERSGRVTDDAPLLLRFTTASVSARDASAAAGRGGGRGGRGVGAALITGARTADSSKPAAAPDNRVRYRVTATIERRDGGEVLWQSEVTAIPDGDNARRLPAELAALLVDNIGRTVDTRPPAEDSGAR